MRQVKIKLKNVCQGSQFEVDITEIPLYNSEK